MANYSGMIAALMAGEAARGIGQAYRQKKAERGFIAQAAEMFSNLGTDEGASFAAALQENPMAAMARAKAFGGFEKMYEGMRMRAAQKTLASTLQNAYATQGNQPLTKQQVVSELLPKFLNAGVPNAVGLAQTLLQSASAGGSMPPQWWGENVDPSDWTGQSYIQALRYGQQTNDWEGSLDKLQPKPQKDPNKLSPGQQGEQEVIRILNKNRKAQEDYVAKVPPDQIDVVTKAEEQWINDYRKARGLPMDKFNRFVPPKNRKPGSAQADPTKSAIDPGSGWDADVIESTADYISGLSE